MTSKSGILSVRGGNGIGSFVKTIFPSSRRVRRIGVLILARGVTFLGGDVCSSFLSSSGAELSLMNVSIAGVSGTTGTISVIGMVNRGIENEPPDNRLDQLPDDSESGFELRDVTVTVSIQFTMRESGPEVTVTEAVLFQADE